MRWLNYILSMEFLIRLFQLLLTAILQAPSTCGRAIACTAGDFPVGANASLLCYFPDDIDNHDSVLVQYYPFSAPTDASYVLHCKAEDVKASTCKEQDGYVLKSHTRNTLVIGIVNITEKAAGRYNCQFLPHDHSPREMCSLTVRGKTAGVTPMEVEARHLDVSQDSSAIYLHSDETGTVSVGTLVGVIVAVIFVTAVVIIIIVVIVFHRRRKRALAAPLINTQSSGTQTLATGTVVKRSIQTQVYVDRGLAGSPLINTQSNVTKTPATGTTGSTLVQDNSEMNCEMELAQLKPSHKGQPKELVNSSDCLTERTNLDTILENVTADPHWNV